MTILFASNDINDWTGSFTKSTDTSTFDNTRVPYSISFTDGNAALRGNHPVAAGDTTWYNWQQHNTNSMGGSEDGYQNSFYDENGLEFCLIDIDNGYWRVGLRISDSDAWNYGSGSVSTFTPSDHISVKIVVGANITVTIYRDSVEFCSHTLVNTGSAVVNPARVRFIDNDIAGWMYFSEFLVADHDIRGARVSKLSPSAAGNHTQFSGAVADLSDEDYITGMFATAAAQRQSMTVGSYGGGSSISAVVACGMAAGRDAAITQMAPFVRVGSTDYDGSNQTLEPALGFITSTWELNPADSAAWEIADLTGIELGFKSVA